MGERDNPLLSVVITVVGGKPFLRRCLSRLVPQVRGRAIEILVPFDRTAGDLGTLRDEFPEVNFLDQGDVPTRCRPGTAGAEHELYDRRKSWGLLAARGQVLALLEDFAPPAPDWCDQVLEAHRLPHGVIGGTVEHEGRGALNWAVYLQDFGRYRPPLPEGPSSYLTDVNVTYKRPAIESVRELWEGRYNEVTVHWALARRGVVLWQRPQCVVYQDRGRLTFRAAVAERFCWGRLFGSRRARELRWPVWAFYLAASPAVPLILLARMAKKAFGARRHWGPFLTALPYAVLLTSAWCLGEFVGLLTGRESASRGAGSAASREAEETGRSLTSVGCDAHRR
jgi:hypothetical protein